MIRNDGTTRGTVSPDGGEIAVLYKERAWIGGAEVGCQGEVGSACSMAAAGLAELLRRSTAPGRQCRRDRHRAQPGSTCDPIGGLSSLRALSALRGGDGDNAAKMACMGTASTGSRWIRRSRRCGKQDGHA